MTEVRDELMDDIYESLKEIQEEEEVNLSEKGFTADFLSQKLLKLGYHKLPEGEIEHILETQELLCKLGTSDKGDGSCSLCRSIKEKLS